MSGLDGVAEVSNDLAAAQAIVEVTVDRKAAAQFGLTETQVTGIASAAMTGSQHLASCRPPTGPSASRSSRRRRADHHGRDRGDPGPDGGRRCAAERRGDVEVAGRRRRSRRIDGERSATVSVTPAGDDLGAVTDTVNAEIESIDLPAGATVTVGGAAADQAEAFSDLGMALLAAIALVFIVMVATFRSLAQPFILLVSVPFAAVGALVALLPTTRRWVCPR